MPSPAITVENLSKVYRLGLKDDMPDTLVGAVQRLVRAPLKNYRRLSRMNTFKDQAESDDTFWALRDVSFDVAEGEVIGIIGRNGAGKSTLLKILSRITEPTSGRATIRGRVSSLLEVGTGFHQELSGRENVYMNGTILGMTKREIDRKFDEIVEFSGVEKFLDTPIKHYSSGMKVRLAFSVAAHLEPEILIIDEVLAVGDGEFQKKCLGKMQDVARCGRTVLFVSHSFSAVESLCTRAIEFGNGLIVSDGRVNDVLLNYRARLYGNSRDLHENRFAGLRYFESAELVDSNGTITDKYTLGDEFHLSISLTLPNSLRLPVIGVGIDALDGQRILTCMMPPANNDLTFANGRVRISCRVNPLPLPPGQFTLKVALADQGDQLEAIEQLCYFSVLDSKSANSAGFHRGLCYGQSEWSVTQLNQVQLTKH